MNCCSLSSSAPAKGDAIIRFPFIMRSTPVPGMHIVAIFSFHSMRNTPASMPFFKKGSIEMAISASPLPWLDRRTIGIGSSLLMVNPFTQYHSLHCSFTLRPHNYLIMTFSIKNIFGFYHSFRRAVNANSPAIIGLYEILNFGGFIGQDTNIILLTTTRGGGNLKPSS